MGKYTWEKRLALLYLIGMLLGIITTVCSVVPSVHWEEILDNCVTRHCSCVLYGSYTSTIFNGGPDEICNLIKFSSIPAVITGALLSAYHGYRVCIKSQKTNRKYNHRTGQVAVVQPDNEPAISDPACHCWILYVVLGCCISILLMATAVILSDGYQKSCSEYRKIVVKHFPTIGLSTRVIYDRLTCSSIFDFMDYLEPTTRPFFQKEDKVYHGGPFEERDFRRGDFINTAASLLLAILSAWLNSAVWVMIVVCNVMLSKMNKIWCKIR